MEKRSGYVGQKEARERKLGDSEESRTKRPTSESDMGFLLWFLLFFSEMKIKGIIIRTGRKS